MKITKSDVEAMFFRLARAMGKGVDAGKHNGLHLEYIACYGGYLIYDYEPQGMCYHPFGLERRNKREMYLSMYMAAKALEEMKR